MINRLDIELDDQLVPVSDVAGDWIESDSSETDADLIVRLNKGELRYAPWLGYGVMNRLRSVSNNAKNIRELKVELESDGFKNPIVQVTKDDLSDLQIII